MTGWKQGAGAARLPEIQGRFRPGKPQARAWPGGLSNQSLVGAGDHQRRDWPQIARRFAGAISSVPRLRSFPAHLAVSFLPGPRGFVGH